MNDLEFVRRCVGGDKQAWDEFIDKYSRLMYCYIYSVLKTKGYNFTRENIRDLFQEVILLLCKDKFRKLGSFKAKNGCSLASWLRQVAVNSAIDYLRRVKPAVSIDAENDKGFSLTDLLSCDSPSAADIVSQEERLEELKDCIAKLTIDDKYFLELHTYRGLSLEELKGYFQVSRPAIDMRKFRIIERLKDCFRRKGFILPSGK